MAVVFLVLVFIFKNKTASKNEENQNQAEQVSSGEGLTYSDNETLGDVLNKDTDGDGLPDWEERLWGTDPTKKETTPGIKDSIAIETLKTRAEIGRDQQGESSSGSSSGSDDKALTKTDQFSRELLSTITSLSESGPLDQATVDKISSSLAEQIKNPTTQKVFSLSDLKVTADNSAGAIQNYSNTISGIHARHPIKRTVMDVLKDFAADEENVNVTVLSELDPINKEVQGIISDFLKVSVPEFLAPAHLEVINTMQSLSENIDNIKLFDTDTVVALSAISQYQTNTDRLDKALKNLTDMINKN